MSGVPYIRFFGDDWLSGTNALSLEERGALITIAALISATGGPVVCDYDRLSRRMGCTKAKTKKVLAALVDQGKISIESGAIFNDRALKETKIAQKKSRNSSKSAHERWSKMGGISNKNKPRGDANAMRTHSSGICQPEPEPEPELECPSVTLVKKPETENEIIKAFDIFKAMAKRASLPVPMKLSGTRMAKLRRRMKDAGGIKGWIIACEKVEASKFCTGQNDKGWTADLDFMLQESSFTKIMEGSYDNRTSTGFNGPPPNGRRSDPHSEQMAAFAEVAAQGRGGGRSG